MNCPLHTILFLFAFVAYGCSGNRTAIDNDSRINLTGSKNLDYEMVMTIKNTRQRVDKLLLLKKLWMPVDGYEDAVHIRYYRMINFQIVRYGYAAGKHNAADESLNWLMDTDKDLR